MSKLRLICENCGKTMIYDTDFPESLFNAGWDYPPLMGIPYKSLSPRTCSQCGIDTTLYMRLLFKETTLETLNDHDKEVLARILAEPESLMIDE